MFADSLTVVEIAEAVERFNSRYAEMERVLWCLSRASADALLAQKEQSTIEEFIWSIRSWWGIQGVRKETKSIAASVLSDSGWERHLLEPSRVLDRNGERLAVDRVADFVERMMTQGTQRREWSLASKVLH